MTHHERTTLADRCARCDGAPDAQALLAEARAQVEEARRERDEARLAAEQGVKVAEALATEKAALLSRVVVLEAALRGLGEAAQVMAESHAEFHDNVILRETVDDPMDAAIIAARAALEVEP